MPRFLPRFFRPREDSPPGAKAHRVRRRCGAFAGASGRARGVSGSTLPLASPATHGGTRTSRTPPAAAGTAGTAATLRSTAAAMVLRRSATGGYGPKGRASARGGAIPSARVCRPTPLASMPIRAPAVRGGAGRGAAPGVQRIAARGHRGGAATAAGPCGARARTAASAIAGGVAFISAVGGGPAGALTTVGRCVGGLTASLGRPPARSPPGGPTPMASRTASAIANDAAIVQVEAMRGRGAASKGGGASGASNSTGAATLIGSVPRGRPQMSRRGFTRSNASASTTTTILTGSGPGFSAPTCPHRGPHGEATHRGRTCTSTLAPTGSPLIQGPMRGRTGHATASRTVSRPRS